MSPNIGRRVGDRRPQIGVGIVGMAVLASVCFSTSGYVSVHVARAARVPNRSRTDVCGRETRSPARRVAPFGSEARPSSSPAGCRA